jgi:tetratricopeptide (TPR) repeat protein
MEARAQASLGTLAEQAHRPEEAKQFITAALGFFERAGYTRDMIQASGVLGSALYQLGDYEEGVHVLQQALTGAVSLHDSRLEGQVRERLGDNLRGKGDWPSALTEYEQAARLYGSSITAQRQLLLCAKLYFRLGRRADSERSLSEVQEFLRKAGPNQGLQDQLRATHAEMEYADGHFGQALALAGQTLQAALSDEVTEQQLKLITSWVLIRNGRISQGSNVATSVIAGMEKSKLMGDAAYARLSTAEALLAAGAPIPASQWAVDPLAFFEPRRIWEPVVRAHLVAARASRDSAEGNTHIASARAAFGQLKKFWPPATLEGYRNRPDFQRLCQGIVL